MIGESYTIAQKYIDNKIGEHLTTQVMNYLWGWEHYNNVTKQFITYNIKAGKMQLFLTKNILPIITNIDDIRCKHYTIQLKYYNSFLKEVANSNGLRIYLMNHYPHMVNITHFITQHRFVGVNTSYKYICNYCFCLSNRMQYHVITNFKKLNDTN
jgi:hypothetical protein